MMFFLMGTMAAAAYDEQNNWGLFRLTMPVSRRDIVLARYGVIVTLGLMGLAAGVGRLCGAARALRCNRPAVRSFGGHSFRPGYAARCDIRYSVLHGARLAHRRNRDAPSTSSLVRTRPTQWLPMITVLLFVGPMLIINGTGILDNAAISMDMIAQLLGFIETPVGVAACLGIAVVFTLAVLGISSAISLKLYERREL